MNSSSASAEMRQTWENSTAVTVDSALGLHKDAARTLHFAPDRQWVAQGVNHMALLSDAGVHAQLVAWLRPPANPAQPSRGAG